MTREEKIKFCKESELEFCDVVSEGWDKLDDEQLDKEVEWFDNLWNK